MSTASNNIMAPKKQPIQCAICTRKAQYHHFNVPACQGCGFFFKRCIFKNKHYVCFRDGSCMMHEMGVLNCRSCRFDKCILAGMSLEAMHLPGEFDLEMANQRIVAKRAMLKANGRFSKENSSMESAIKMQPNLSSNSPCGDLLLPLIPIERAYHQIWNSPNILCHEYANRHKTLRELVKDGGNLLANAGEYTNSSPVSCFDKAAFIAELDANGAFSLNYMNQTMVKDWFLSVELTKAMPFFKQLDLEDQVNQLKHVFDPICSLFGAYYAQAISAKTVTRGNGYTPISLVETARYCCDEKIRATCSFYMLEMVERMGQCGIEYPEFLLLFAVLIASSNAENLSEHGRELLYAESVRYSQALLKMLQTKFGIAFGSAKFASLLKMLELSFAAKYKFDDIMAYIEVFYERKDPKQCTPMAIQELVFGNLEQQ